MRRHLTLMLAATLGFCTVSVLPARAGPRERKIKKLEQKIRDLQRSMRQAMVYRAKYATLKANSTFLDGLLRQDRRVLNKVLRQLNSPVTLQDAFLSWVKKDPKKAKRQRGKYNPPSTYLWLDVRFGLSAVKKRSYFTIRVDLVDATSGVRIYHSFKPLQKRIYKVRQTIPIQIKGLKVASGNYKLRVQVEVGRSSAKRSVKFRYNKSWRYIRPPRL